MGAGNWDDIPPREQARREAVTAKYHANKAIEAIEERRDEQVALELALSRDNANGAVESWKRHHLASLETV